MPSTRLNIGDTARAGPHRAVTTDCCRFPPVAAPRARIGGQLERAGVGGCVRALVGRGMGRARGSRGRVRWAARSIWAMNVPAGRRALVYLAFVGRWVPGLVRVLQHGEVAGLRSA